MSGKLCKQLVKKYVLNILCDMLVNDGNFLDVLLMYGPIRSHPLKVPRHESNALKEITIASTISDVIIEI